MSDYWKTHTVDQHKQFLTDLVKLGLSNEEMQKYISARFGENTWLFELKEFLRRKVNSEFSDKRKAQFEGHMEEYFSERQEEESKLIFGTNWEYYFENKVDLTELQTFNGDCSPLDPKTVMQIMIQALKVYIDLNEENSPKCQALHNIYLSVKNALSSEIPFEVGDGFVDYLNDRSNRKEIADSRITGTRCIFCGSSDIRSKGAEWKCRSCGRRFSKHY